MKGRTPHDRWHELLTTRYVCQVCLTRFFVRYHRCPACHCAQSMVWLDPEVYAQASDDAALRGLLARRGGAAEWREWAWL